MYSLGASCYELVPLSLSFMYEISVLSKRNMERCV